MKVIYPDRTSDIFATEEASGYPASRLENDYPGRYWKATSEDASIFQYVSPMGNAAAISNTNATSLTFLTYDDGASNLISNGDFEVAGTGADVSAVVGAA